MSTERETDHKETDAPELDPETLQGIKSLLSEAEEDWPARQEREAPRPIPFKADEPARPDTRAARASFVPLADPEEEPKAPPRARRKALKGQGLVDRLRARVTGYRPTPRHIVLASLALLILFRPWLIFWSVFFVIAVLVTLLLVLGYDGLWQKAIGFARWYARRRPSRAAAIHRKLDRFAVKWDAFLDRFPEGTVDGLYLPDFGDPAEASKRHDAALDRRLEGLREG